MSDIFKSLDHKCDPKCSSCTHNLNPLLTGLDIIHRAELDEARSELVLKKGDIIFREGMFPSGLFCLRKGKVMITRADEFGNEIITNLHKEVTFLGIADFILQKPYQSKCTALEEVEVCLINIKSVNDFISENKVFAHRIMVTLAEQFHDSNIRMLAVTKKHMDARLADALLELENTFGKSNTGHIDVYLKRSELAILSNMSEANLIRHLSSFNDLGVVSIEGKKIKILKPEKLIKYSTIG